MEQYVFEIMEDEEDNLPYLTISPKSYYEQEKCVFDGGYPAEIYDFLRNKLQAYEVTDSTFELPYNMSNDEVKTVLLACAIAAFEEIVFFPQGIAN